MNRIDELIAKLCPNGVDFRPLEDACGIYDGTHQTPQYTDSGVRFVSVENIRALKQTRKYISEEDFERNYKYKPRSGDVFMTRIGTIGACAVVETDEPLAYYVTLALLRPNREMIVSKYLKFILESAIGAEELRKRTLVKATPIKINLGEIGKIRIPLPPLEVQREIANILDDFTQLEAELEAELEARRRQYRYYRDALLTFGEPRTPGRGTVRHLPMAEVAEIRSGWGFPTSEQGVVDAAYPFYKVSDMNHPENVTVMTVANNYIDEATKKKLGVAPAPAGTIIFPKIGAAVATNKKRLLSRPAAYDNNVMGLIPGEQINARFLFHWMQTIDLTDLAHDSGAVPSIRKSEMENLEVPVPTLEEQTNIIAILDKFDALVNGISTGLPAEIKARRQQYEHYRDRLLTFPEAK